MSKRNTTEIVSISLDPEVKLKVETILAQFGISIEQAINLFLSEIVKDGQLPLTINEPEVEYLSEADEKELRKAFEDVKAGRVYKIKPGEDITKFLDSLPE